MRFIAQYVDVDPWAKAEVAKFAALISGKGSAAAAPVSQSAQTPPQATTEISAAPAIPSAKDQAATLALKTLTAISDQLSAANKAAAKDDSNASKAANAAPTDAASVALSMLQQAQKAQEAAAADDKKAQAAAGAAQVTDATKTVAARFDTAANPKSAPYAAGSLASAVA